MHINKTSITGLVLTYGNRSHLANACIERLYACGVKKIVLVVNNQESKQHSYSDKAHHVFMNANTGSAAGFGLGLAFVRQHYPETYVWLFDDDNLIEYNAAEKLLAHANELIHSGSIPILISYRIDRGLYRKLAETGNTANLYSRTDRFRSFDIWELRKHRQMEEPANFLHNRVQVAIGPYGGLFFPVKLVDLIGYPDRNYVFYCDDYDYTLRMTNAGYRIHFCRDVVVHDAECSWNMKGFAFLNLLNLNPSVLYFNVRNTAYFEQTHKMTDKKRYFINAAIYIAMVSITGILTGRIRKLLIFYRAINDSRKSLRADTFNFC